MSVCGWMSRLPISLNTRRIMLQAHTAHCQSMCLSLSVYVWVMGLERGTEWPLWSYMLAFWGGLKLTSCVWPLERQVCATWQCWRHVYMDLTCRNSAVLSSIVLMISMITPLSMIYQIQAVVFSWEGKQLNKKIVTFYLTIMKNT